MMPRTYPDREAYDAACERLAAHLNTLDATQHSLVYADGGTTDAEGQTWLPADERMVAAAAWNTWFVEEHGAGALWAGGQWVAAEPSEDELTDLGAGWWGEPGRDFGYPYDPGPDRRIPLWAYVAEESDDGRPRHDPAKVWRQVGDGYSDGGATATVCARDVMDAYLQNAAPGPVTWDVRVMVWGQGHDTETFETADAVVYAPESR